MNVTTTAAIRHVIQTLAGMLAGYGFFSQSLVEPIVGFVIAGLTLGWMIFDQRKRQETVVEATEAVAVKAISGQPVTAVDVARVATAASGA